MHRIEDIQTVESRIQEIRHDHKDKLVPLGEFLDNSKDWGEAKNINIVLRGDKIIIYDDGVGITSDRLKHILKFGHKNKNVQQGKIGKFGLGLKKGSIILGNKISVYTKHKNEYNKTIADWGDMSENNCYAPIIESMSKCDINIYIKYITSTGTLIFIENLIKPVNKKFYEDLVNYCKSLYQNMDDTTITIEFEKLRTIINNFTDPIYFNELSRNFKKHFIVNVYQDSNEDKYSHIIEKIGHKTEKYCKVTKKKTKHGYSFYLKEVTKPKDKHLYTFEIYGSCLTTQIMEKEQNDFINLNWDEKKGFYFYRENRNLSGFIGLKCNLILFRGMYRAKGVRIKVVFPSCVDDENFGVSSLKMITEKSYFDMHNYLKDIIDYAGSYFHKKYEAIRVKDRKEADKNIGLQIKKINTNGFNDLNDIKETLDIIKQIIINKEYCGFEYSHQNGKVREIKKGNYIDKVKNLIKKEENLIEQDKKLENLKNNTITKTDFINFVKSLIDNKAEIKETTLIFYNEINQVSNSASLLDSEAEHLVDDKIVSVNKNKDWFNENEDLVSDNLQNDSKNIIPDDSKNIIPDDSKNIKNNQEIDSSSETSDSDDDVEENSVNNKNNLLIEEKNKLIQEINKINEFFKKELNLNGYNIQDLKNLIQDLNIKKEQRLEKIQKIIDFMVQLKNKNHCNDTDDIVLTEIIEKFNKLDL